MATTEKDELKELQKGVANELTLVYTAGFALLENTIKTQGWDSIQARVAREVLMDGYVKKLNETLVGIFNSRITTVMLKERKMNELNEEKWLERTKPTKKESPDA